MGSTTSIDICGIGAVDCGVESTENKREAYHKNLFMFGKKKAKTQSLICGFIRSLNSTRDANTVAEQNIVGLCTKFYRKPKRPSAKESSTQQFYIFLQSIKMERYFTKFAENDVNYMESIAIFDDEDLQHHIGITSRMARKNFLNQCKCIVNQQQEFKNNYGIPALLYNRLVQYGIVTMNILCNEIRERADMNDTFEYVNHKQCDLLWDLIQKQENMSEIAVERIIYE
eukprot:183633_1